MARTPTFSISLGFTAPDFELFEPLTGAVRSLQELKGEHATVVMFICNHCPFVIHVQQELVRIANEFTKQGVSFIAISSNDIENYPQDGPDAMKAHALHNDYPFPYLFDETQDVAKAYYAACTPDFSVFDSDLKCLYRGQLDASRPGNDIPVSGFDLRYKVLVPLLKGMSVTEVQTPSIGCNIKWKKGQEPNYF
jgi:peroxiredoxin